MERLQLEVQELLQHSLAPRTHSLYRRAWNLYQEFCTLHGFGDPLFSSLQSLVQFIAFLSINGYASTTIASYVSGIASSLRLAGSPDITKHFIVKRLLEGSRRLDSRRDLRRPITFSILRRIVPALDSICTNQFEAQLFRAAFLFAFFGFLRVGEFTAKSKHVVSPLRHSDVSLQVAPTGRVVVLNVRFSKTDQYGRGCFITIPECSQGDFALCPVRAAAQFLSVLRPHCSSFFSHFNGDPVTRSQFTAVLQRSLDFVSLGDMRFSSHSFRIGAATSAAMSGIPEADIQAMGRWKSNAYSRYIRIDPGFIL